MRTIASVSGWAAGGVALVAALWLAGCGTGESVAMNQANNNQSATGSGAGASPSADHQKATFGAGCFWGTEEVFRKVPGVVETAVGFSGGRTVNPSYKDVCRGDTGHVEVLEIDFDPAVVSYEKLVEMFFGMHDPTTLNRQGPDVGSQYRSAIFYHGPEQERTAIMVKDRLDRAKQFKRPIVTAIEPAGPFYRAEEYHQRYHEKHGGFCPR